MEKGIYLNCNKNKKEFRSELFFVQFGLKFLFKVFYLYNIKMLMREMVEHSY